LPAFNTIESAYDLADLRTALGVQQWNVFAHSYGTGLALNYMGRDPSGIRSVVLDGVMPPSHAELGSAWLGARAAFDSMTNACAAQPACQARYPNLAQTFIDQVNQLDAHPVTTTVNVPQVGDTAVVLDGVALMGWLITATHFPTEFPASVDDLAHGNPQRIAELIARAKVNPAHVGVMGAGMGLSVMCSEWVPLESPEDTTRAAHKVFPELPDSVKAHPPQVEFLRQQCDVWNVPKASDATWTIADSPIPTLLLSGGFDGQTPPQLVQYVAPYLSHSTSVTVPGKAHAVFRHPCGATIIASFFDTPEQPDTGCAHTTKPPPYLITPPP
jgi:pimeloyl-ACP methyl ester carboxylesterase